MITGAAFLIAATSYVQPGAASGTESCSRDCALRASYRMHAHIHTLDIASRVVCETVRERQYRSRRRLLAAIRICPLAATKKTLWPSQNVTGFASRRTATLPRTPIPDGWKGALAELAITGISPGSVRPLRGRGGFAGDEHQFKAGTLRRAADICQLVTR